MCSNSPVLFFEHACYGIDALLTAANDSKHGHEATERVTQSQARPNQLTKQKK